jgi:hypothetical protein
MRVALCGSQSRNFKTAYTHSDDTHHAACHASGEVAWVAGGDILTRAADMLHAQYRRIHIGKVDQVPESMQTCNRQHPLSIYGLSTVYLSLIQQFTSGRTGSRSNATPFLCYRVRPLGTHKLVAAPCC